jgi:glycosyltransferase involved in cell wall biosynthesis
MNDKKILSICIPTYNRLEILKFCLERLFLQIVDQANIEVVVVDNASTDGTGFFLKEFGKSKGDSFRYIIRPETIDISQQFSDTLLQGFGEWTVYLADDDRLDVGIILQHIDSVKEKSNISVIYSDWYAWNDQDEKEIHRYFQIGGERFFESGRDELSLLNFILNARVLPEIGIYRSSFLNEAMIGGVMSGFHQILLGLFKIGGVLFRDPPFYYENRVLKKHLQRTHWANIDLQGGQLDGIRGALENVAAALLGGKQLESTNRLKLHEMIDFFVSRRISVLRNRAIAAKKWLEALRFEDRIRLWFPQYGLSNHQEPGKIAYNDLVRLACIDKICERANIMESNQIIISDRLRGLAGLFQSHAKCPIKMQSDCAAAEANEKYFHVFFDNNELEIYLLNGGKRANAINFIALAKAISNTSSILQRQA